MGLFKKQCGYCRNKIERSKEIIKDVRVPGFIGTYPKHFCTKEHAEKYEQEAEEHLNKSKSGGRCCS